LRPVGPVAEARRANVGVRGLDRGERAALILNECQNNMINVEVAPQNPLARLIHERGMVEKLAALAQACREAGVLVVHSTIAPRPDFVGTEATSLLLASLVKKKIVYEGAPGAAIHPALTPQEGDVVLNRVHGLAPFHGTELEWILRAEKVSTVIVTGVSTNVGVPGACLEATQRAFTAVVPEDCIAGSSTEIHDFQVKHTLPLLATVTTSEDIKQVLAARSAA
jgi:nicotinamidase-related amidase